MRFFQKYPRKGDDVTIPGFAQGLRKMALALERMDVQNGYVKWRRGTPTIIFQPEEEAETVLDEAPASGDYVLMSKDGTLQWVELEEFTCPSEGE